MVTAPLLLALAVAITVHLVHAAPLGRNGSEAAGLASPAAVAAKSATAAAQQAPRPRLRQARRLTRPADLRGLKVVRVTLARAKDAKLLRRLAHDHGIDVWSTKDVLLNADTLEPILPASPREAVAGRSAGTATQKRGATRTVTVTRASQAPTPRHRLPARPVPRRSLPASTLRPPPTPTGTRPGSGGKGGTQQGIGRPPLPRPRPTLTRNPHPILRKRSTTFSRGAAPSATAVAPLSTQQTEQIVTVFGAHIDILACDLTLALLVSELPVLKDQRYTRTEVLIADVEAAAADTKRPVCASSGAKHVPVRQPAGPQSSSSRTHPGYSFSWDEESARGDALAWYWNATVTTSSNNHVTTGTSTRATASQSSSTPIPFIPNGAVELRPPPWTWTASTSASTATASPAHSSITDTSRVIPTPTGTEAPHSGPDPDPSGEEEEGTGEAGNDADGLDSGAPAEGNPIGAGTNGPIAIDDGTPQPSVPYPEAAALAWTPVGSKHNLTSAYLPLAQLNAYLVELAEAYPHLITLGVAGPSTEGNPIYWARLTAPAAELELGNFTLSGKSVPRTDRRAVLLTGGMHAREWIAPSVLINLLDVWTAGYGNSPIVTDMLEMYEIIVIPMVNPDGYFYSWEMDRLWRKNTELFAGDCFGVDLNRNFATNEWADPLDFWASSPEPCDDTYRGLGPGSSAETAAVQAFVLEYQRVTDGQMQFFLDAHSYSLLWMFPSGYNCNAAYEGRSRLDDLSLAAAEAIYAVHGTIFTHGDICNTIYPTSGSATDWVFQKANITYSFAVELRDSGEHGFLLPPEEILPSVQEFHAGMLTAIAGFDAAPPFAPEDNIITGAPTRPWLQVDEVLPAEEAALVDEPASEDPAQVVVVVAAAPAAPAVVAPQAPPTPLISETVFPTPTATQI